MTAPTINVLLDLGDYHLAAPPRLRLDYDELKSEYLTNPLRGLGEASATADRAAQLKRVLDLLRALHLLLRSNRVDSFDLVGDFYDLKTRFEWLVEGDDAWLALGRFSDVNQRRKIAEVARAILTNLTERHDQLQGRAASDPVGESTSRVRDPNIVEIPSQVGRPPVLFENQFVNSMVEHWAVPNLVSTSHVVEALHLLDARAFRIFSVSSALLHYVADHYARGGFRPARDADPDLYGTRSAIVIYKAALDIKCDGWLGSELSQQRFPDFGTERRKEVVFATLEKLDRVLAEMGRDGSTIIDLFHSIYIVKNLAGAPRRYERPMRLDSQDIRDRESRIITYLRECFRAGPPDGFVLAPNAIRRCLTACIFAHRVVHDCDILDKELSARIDRCRTFVRSAFSREEGGFGSAEDAAPDMIHTYLGITLNEQRGWRLDHEINGFRQGLQRFLNQCNKGGGFALAAEMKPSAYGTRLALQILDRAQLPLANPFRTRRFLQSLGGDPEGYRGHHAEPPDPQLP